MGVRNFFYDHMGVSKVFLHCYGGTKNFGAELWGSEIFGHFSQKFSGWVPGVKKDPPLRHVGQSIIIFVIFIKRICPCNIV